MSDFTPWPDTQRGVGHYAPLLFNTSFQPEVRADVVLGQPQAQCRYHGICRIESPDITAPSGCRGPRVTGILRWYHPGRCLLLIERGQLPAEEEHYHFGKGPVTLHRAQSLLPFWRFRGNGRQFLPGQYSTYRSPLHFGLTLVVV